MDFIKNFEILEQISFKLLSSYQSSLSPSAKEYLLNKRKLLQDEIDFYQLGYSPGFNLKLNFKDDWVQYGIDKGLFHKTKEGNIKDGMAYRITIPIHNEHKQLVGFQGRYLTSETQISRYKNAFLLPGTIYGYNYILPEHYKKIVFITEGFFDYLSLRRIVNPVICTFTSKVSKRQIRSIKRYFTYVILCLDNDASGEDASSRLQGEFESVGLKSMSISIPKEFKVKDWAEVYEKHGIDNVKKLLQILVKKQDSNFPLL